MLQLNLYRGQHGFLDTHKIKAPPEGRRGMIVVAGAEMADGSGSQSSSPQCFLPAKRRSCPAFHLLPGWRVV